ncbi:MAG TPA: hypothetical protein VMV05_02985 [bacterium]|nr:hypothetical protein [bacterium]
MDSIFLNPSLSPVAPHPGVSARLIDSFGSEIDNILTAVQGAAVPASPTLGTHVDVRV